MKSDVTKLAGKLVALVFLTLLYAIAFRFYILAYIILFFVAVFLALPVLLNNKDRAKRGKGVLLLAGVICGSGIALYWEGIGLPNW